MNSRARNVGPYKWIKSKLSSQTSFSSTLEEKHQPLLALCLIFATLTALFRYVPPAQAREHGFHIVCKVEIHMMKDTLILEKKTFTSLYIAIAFSALQNCQLEPRLQCNAFPPFSSPKRFCVLVCIVNYMFYTEAGMG